MAQLKVKNWAKYQHYKDRCPPWIKLATNTFQDYDFSRLQDASKLLALCIWTLAARSQDGSLPHDFDYIKSQCCLGITVKLEHLKELITQGFIESDSELLADCKQGACLETEGETEAEIEREAEKPMRVTAPKVNERGTRIPSNFQVTNTHRQFSSEHNYQNPDEVIQTFRDYWTAKPGAAGRKLDWDATFRVWLSRTERGNRNGRKQNYADKNQAGTVAAVRAVVAKYRGMDRGGAGIPSSPVGQTIDSAEARRLRAGVDDLSGAQTGSGISAIKN